MASTTTRMSSVLFLLLAAFAAGASAATFTIKNNCGYAVWPMGTPVSWSTTTTQLNPGQTSTVNVPRGTNGEFWGVNAANAGCTFNTTTYRYDCPGQTMAEYSIGGAKDYYDISVVGGYNLPMAFSCSTGVRLVCTSPSCPDAYHHPTDTTKTHACNANSNYQVTLCP